MESHPQSVSVNMQPYGWNRAGSPATAFGPTVTPVVQPQPAPSPPDFVLWSFFNAMYCNYFCLGFIALVFSIKSRDRKMAHDPETARSYGKTAKHLNIAAVCLGTVLTIILTVVLLVIYSNSLRLVGSV
ncbi:PREDICTED: dispanin subfamily A member 2b-like [Calidris pugnax]|uniref:dispanin subfamily A member 2b-like n=1 Tax=Calidris pugnax TaxID=198806 RepID=UPI00071DA6B4|nr:PREDICTED: dispanin subfamily A member 2b-like [Calidris pugnax]